MNMDRTILSSVMLARVKLAQVSREQATLEASEDWFENHVWFGSPSTKSGSFIWFCEQLDLEPSAVRASLTHAA